MANDNVITETPNFWDFSRNFSKIFLKIYNFAKNLQNQHKNVQLFNFLKINAISIFIYMAALGSRKGRIFVLIPGPCFKTSYVKLDERRFTITISFEAFPELSGRSWAIESRGQSCVRKARKVGR